ncbi:MAG: methyltransferase domain-containing protein [Candidatus Eisenbacteria bacterium]|nr:methyltransferase domain-containing protein [Candidatus Eisenbacteria bacterium]
MASSRRIGRAISNGRVARLAERFYPDRLTADADEAFFHWIRSKLPERADVLEIGAGPGHTRVHGLRTTSRSVTGIDLDPAVLSNPSLTRALVSGFETMPFPDEAFDAVIANNVVEHLDDPVALVVASIRVLRKGGSLYLKTPNLDHYVGVAGRLTPHWFHVAYNHRRGRPEGETHRTRYRMNTVRAISRCAHRCGLDAEVRTFEGTPEYLISNPGLFLAGVLYERAVNAASLLRPFRCVLLARLTRV